jgi:hypothetical protein
MRPHTFIWLIGGGDSGTLCHCSIRAQAPAQLRETRPPATGTRTGRAAGTRPPSAPTRDGPRALMLSAAGVLGIGIRVLAD